MSQGSQEEHEIELNGITMDSYNMHKYIWNQIRGETIRNLSFFKFCLSTWLSLKSAHFSAVDSNMPHLFQAPYCWARHLVIVGAQSELERLRGKWTCLEEEGVAIIRYLRGWRFHASSEYGPDPLVPDTEQEYFAEIPDYVPTRIPEPASETDA